jgi:glycosyltransferase involved in cell wall biosynthesis
MSRPPIRLLYVQPAEAFGGAERQGVLHISKLAGHGFHVTPVVGPGALIRSALADEGIHDYVFLKHLSHGANHPMGGARKVAFAARAVADWIATERSIRALIVARRIQIIVANRTTGWIAAGPVARLLGIPIVWRGGSRITAPFQAHVLKFLSRRLRPDFLLANCEAVRADLVPLVGCPSEILRNGVDTRRFDPARVPPRFRQGLGIADDVPVVGFSSRPAPGKGIELLAHVAERTAQKLPKVQFLVAGEFGWRRHFEQMAVARGLGGRLRFLGHVPDVETFLRSCDAVVLTSKAKSIEGSPNALLEAMAMERPVVATRVGGVGEAVTDGVEGFLVDEDQGDAFATRLADLLSDRDRRLRMGRAGRAAVVDKFHSEKVVANLANLLHSLLAQTPTTTERVDRDHRGRIARAA